MSDLATKSTLIRVKVSTKERLDALGKKNTSYDDIIRALLYLTNNYLPTE